MKIIDNDFIRSTDNIADTLTKPRKQAKLQAFLDIGKLNTVTKIGLFRTT